MLNTIGYWKFAKLLNMGMKWLLFIPFYRQAYIGLIANAYAKEQKCYSTDLSLWEVSIFSCILISLGFLHQYKSLLWALIVLGLLCIRAVVRFSTHYYVFRLRTRKPFLWALLSWIPGWVLFQAIYAQKHIMDT